MLSKTAIWIILVAVLAGGAAVAYVLLSGSNVSLAPQTTAPDTNGRNLPPPTGNVDDMAREMTDEMTSEANIVGTDDESALIDEDLKALDELGQSYDENEF